jgi:replication factor A1
MADEEKTEDKGKPEDKEFIKVEKLTPSSREVNITIKVVSKNEIRDVMGKGGSHKVTEALVGDETGSIYLTLWNEAIDEIKDESTVKITNGYTSLFKGNLRLNIGRYGKSETLTESPITEVNTENNLSEKEYPQERRRSFGYGQNQGYRRRY